MVRILIVDDEEADLAFEQAILERAGYETILARDGDEALRLFLADPVDIVITDLQMPISHGFELITALRETPDAPPIIAISGTGQAQLAIADALGAKFTFSKPVDPHSLLTAVDQIVRFRRG